MGQIYFGDQAAKWVRITSALTLCPTIGLNADARRIPEVWRPRFGLRALTEGYATKLRFQSRLSLAPGHEEAACGNA